MIILSENLLQRVKHKEGEEDKETTTNKQLILFIIKLLAKLLAPTYPDTFVQAVPIVAQLYAVSSEGLHLVSVNAVLCMAELCSHLGTRLIPYLQLFIPPLLKMLDFQDEQKR